MTPPFVLSNSQINKAGKLLRASSLELAREPLSDDVRWATDMVRLFRGEHVSALQVAVRTLRGVIPAETGIAQRLKELRTVWEKLGRERNLALSRMQDIAGCHVVLADLSSVYTVRSRLLLAQADSIVSDYVTEPRRSGYRAVHVVMRFPTGSTPRPVEIQLRTPVMHDWAVLVEHLAARLGRALKADGQHPVQLWLASLSRKLALEEAGLTVDASLEQELAHRRAAAGPDLEGVDL